MLVNAAGPWIGDVAETVIREPLALRPRLLKGSHIVVPRRFEHDAGYLLQAADGRVVFVLPFAGDFTLIGTTDENFVGDLATPTPTAEEILYLCKTVNEYFREEITPYDPVWSFAGVRALYDDGAGAPEDVTRDYMLTLDERPVSAPLLTIFGGKITTYRRLAEAAMDRIGKFFTPRPRWTAGSTLPGGDFAPDGLPARVAETLRQCAVSVGAARPALDARLRQPRHAHHRRRPRHGRPRRALHRRPHRRRSPLSGRARMGADRRRRALAAQQARPDGDRGGNAPRWPRSCRRCRRRPARKVNKNLPKRAQLQAPISADCHTSVL